MIAPLLRRQALLLRASFYNHTARAVAACHRPWCSAATRSPSNEAEEKATADTFNLRGDKPQPNHLGREGESRVRKFLDEHAVILRDIGPIVFLAKDILNSGRYEDGQMVDLEEEKAIVEKLLAYHPEYEDKVGCGLESIMVDRHPEFYTRCLFVVRTDGGWIDFSYKWCLQNYIRDKYPSHAERFIGIYFRFSSRFSRYIRNKYPMHAYI